MAKQLGRKVTVKAGRLIPVANQNRKLGSNRAYFSLWVEDANGGNERPILLTKSQLEVAEARAKANPEDCPKKGFVMDLLD